MRVLPDTSRLPAELMRELRRIERTLRINIPVETDAARLRESAVRAARAAQRAMPPIRPEVEPRTAEATAQIRTWAARLSRTARITLDANVRLSGIAARLLGGTSLVATGSVAITGLAAAASQAVALAGALAQASGAALVLPGAFAAASAGIGTLVVGLRGVGDALSADDPEEYAEALENLAPAARDAVEALRGMGDAARDLRLSVQDNLFADMAQDLQDLGDNYLPRLESGLSGIATQLNLGARDWLEFANSAASLRDTEIILRNTESMFHQLIPAGAAFSQGLRDIAAVGSDQLPSLGAAITDLGERFAEAMSAARDDGSLTRWIEQGIDALQTLGSIAGNVGGVLAGVFRASEAQGQSLLGTIDSVTAALNESVNSVSGQQGLQSFFESAERAAAALAPIVGSLAGVFANSLAPAIADIAEGAGPGLITLVEGIGTVIDAARPGLARLGEAFTAVMDALEPVMGPLGEFANELLGAVADALEAVAPHLPALGEALIGVGEALLPLLDHLPQIIEFMTFLVEAITPLIEALVTVIGWLADAGSAFGDFASDVAGAARGSGDAMQGLADRIQGPVGTAWSGALALMRETTRSDMDAISLINRATGDLIISMWETHGRALTDINRRQGAAIKAAAEGITAIRQQEAAAQLKAVRDVVIGVQALLTGQLPDAVRAGNEKARVEAQKLPGIIRGGVGDTAQILWGAGASAISGFEAGLRSKWKDVQRLLRNYTAQIAQLKGPPSRDRKLLEPAGRLVMDGFLSGLRSGFGDVESFLRSATERIGGTASASVSLSPPTRTARSRASGGNTINIYGAQHHDEYALGAIVDRRLAPLGR